MIRVSIRKRFSYRKLLRAPDFPLERHRGRRDLVAVLSEPYQHGLYFTKILSWVTQPKSESQYQRLGSLGHAASFQY